MSNELKPRFARDFNLDGHPIYDAKSGKHYFNFDKKILCDLLNGLANEAERAAPEVMRESEFQQSTPKIKLTKTLPSEEGDYYFKGRAAYRVSIVSVRANHCTGLMHVYAGAEERQPVDVYGGYWAKVEQDHFEFE